MSALRFHNTLTRTTEPFHPLEPGRVRMYTCGPTVYNFAHIGNFRAYVFEDLLRRHLQTKGFRVTQVMNLTDVDDKTIRGAQTARLPLQTFTATYKKAFFQDLRTLNIQPAEHYPAATDHIPDMIALIQKLFDKGCAYRSTDGSVYFSIAHWPPYGKLARLNPSALKTGARIDADEYEKDNVADFALWKAWSPRDGDVAWPSPWGRGRPGWHIECSAMSTRYLGPSFDIHTGGVDNIFPHHEDEIAQSEAANGLPLAHTWLHCAHLGVDGRKMSKSLGNFYTLRDLLAKGWSGREIRFLLLATHYRTPLNFSFAGLESARASLRRIDEFTARLATAATPTASPPSPPPFVSQQAAAFEAALDDDLNISPALAALFDTIRLANAALDEKNLPPPHAAALAALFARWDATLGFLQAPHANPTPEPLRRLLDARAAARAAKNWPESDRLRLQILALGYHIKDTPAGQTLSPA